MSLLLSLPPDRRATTRAAATLFLGLLLLTLAEMPVRSADQAKPAPKLELRKGERICILGNTLADRMQHDGWLETYIHSRFPTLDLSFRNLGYPGDEIGGYLEKPDPNRRLRSANFGSGDKWLGFCKADVIFAFFGYNESFAGEEGLDPFKADLADFIKHTLAQQYNGSSAPRLVLFSPIAHENLKNPNLPDGVKNNRRIAKYTRAMAEVAAANHVLFVDLFQPTLDRYPAAPTPWTFNGIHLTEHGNELLAQVIDKALFGPAPLRDVVAIQKLRQAVLERDFYWFERYRTVDGYSIYGGRADLRFMDGQTNRDVAVREMEILDEMTAKRDQLVWAVAQGKSLKIDDNDTKPFIPVKTNKPGPLAGGAHLFLSGEDAIAKMTIAPGLKVELWASEKEFPELSKPVQMAFDAQGRMWVAAWPSYPHWKPKEEMNDKLLILEDTKGAGKADKCTTFADHLHCPTGFEFGGGGVLVAQQPDIMLLKDTKGTGKADYRERVLEGMDSADTHHASNSFVVDPGGAVYWQEGTFHHTQVESPYGPPRRNINAGVYRYEPRRQYFEPYITYGFANPHGHTFDHWGQDIVVDGTGANPYHAALFSGHLDFPLKHGRPPQVYQQRTRPCPGIETLSSRHFPPEYQGSLLVANVIGFQGILRYKIEDNGASFRGTEVTPLLSSSDPNFRPSDLKVGPDGAIYFLDWQNPIIGHMQHNLRDPSRDRVHGRIYRITFTGRQLIDPVQIQGAPIAKLLDLLKTPEDRVRSRAKLELSQHPADEVSAAAKKWVASLDPKDAEYEHHVLEALWVHQYVNVVDVDLLKRVLGSPDFRARAAATHVLCYWRDRVPETLALLKKLAADPAPRVRLEAVRAASFLTVPEAIEVVLISEEHPTDQFLDFIRGETRKALDPIVSMAIKKGREVTFTTTAGARYFLRTIATEDLMKMKRSQGLYLELLFRSGVREEFRREAIRELAKIEEKPELRVLLSAIESKDQQGTNQDEGVMFDLVRLLTSRSAEELTTARAELEKLALKGQTGLTRELGFVALIAADRGTEKVWDLASTSITGLHDLVAALPWIGDYGMRLSLYPKILPLLDGLPKNLASGSPETQSTVGRFVRVEIPGKKKTLTLAEVEVFSRGRNVALQGKASQSSTSNGGAASRGIDGNKSGKFGDAGQTHTAENQDNPWWEVDLGSDLPIEQIVIWNRTDDAFGKRLDGFALKVLDSDRKIVYQQLKQPAPDVKAAFVIGTESPDRAVRRAAMSSLVTVRGKETEVFKALARFLGDEPYRGDALHAMLRIPTTSWPREEAKPLIAGLLDYIRKVPPRERTSPVALDALQMADNLASLLPLEEARTLRKELGDLGVRVLRLGTVAEQMRYDKERLAVKAGKPVEILFENVDLMPHNLVVTQPGAMAEIGELAEKQAQDPAAGARQFVPNSPKVLVKSRLVLPREMEKISFTAPTKPGVYPIVCTYPGHWRRMYAALYVVDDLDAYQADPEGYLAKHDLPIQDEVLKFNRPRTEWKFTDLEDEVKKMSGGRSFGTGKQMFEVAACIACHKFNGVGQEFGPDLTKLDPKQQKLEEILHDILEPSFRINEKYFQYKINLKSGKTVTGLIVKETPTEVHLVENPLAKADVRIIKVADIEDREKSKVSLMPKGLLDKLTHEELLDLVAYVFAKGDPKHPLFMGGHEHHH